MINRIGLVCVWVFDLDEALDFYVGKLGFSVQMDAIEDGHRFVLVTTPDDPELPLMFAVPEPPLMDTETAKQLRELVAKGVLGPGALNTPDCRRTATELKAKGVEFVEEPEDRFYGIDAGFRDPFGNHWRLTQLTAE